VINEFVFQAGFILFAIASAYEEEAFTFPFREIVFDTETKFRKLKTAHRAGAWGVMLILILVGYAEAMMFPGSSWMKLLAGIMCSAVCGFCYWQVFDSAYSFRIGKGLFYLGNTPEFDGWLIKSLGKNAGAKKALFCVVVIIAINLTYGLLLH
jgi:hypothetical protein